MFLRNNPEFHICIIGIYLLFRIVNEDTFVKNPILEYFCALQRVI